MRKMLEDEEKKDKDNVNKDDLGTMPENNDKNIKS
jgi:hypothetical protein